MSPEAGPSLLTAPSGSPHATVYRTHTCGELRKPHEKAQVRLAGRVSERTGPRAFLLRDTHGETLCSMDERMLAATEERYGPLRVGDVLSVQGSVLKRRETDAARPTGEVFVLPKAIEMLSRATDAPLATDQGPKHLRYRYLELRRSDLKERLRRRSRLLLELRRALGEASFAEIETPYLEPWSSNETLGFVVPTQPGKVFALPSGHRVYPQLLMAGGVDRAFQIARCFQRGKAPTERTVLDIAAAFVKPNDLIALVEMVLARVWPALRGGSLTTPCTRLTYQESLSRYGSEIPDERITTPVRDVTDDVRRSGWLPIAKGGEDEASFALRLPGAAEKLDNELIASEAKAVQSEADGVVAVHHFWIDEKKSLHAPTAGDLTSHSAGMIRNALQGGPGDIAFLVASAHREVAARGAGRLCRRLSEALGFVDQKRTSLVWVTDEPFFVRTGKGWRRMASARAAPDPEQRGLVTHDEAKQLVRAQTLRLVFDGQTVGEGEFGTHEPAMLRKVGKMCGLAKDAVERMFSTPLEAFRYGAPPHGVLRIDLDRLLAVAFGVAIDEVTAFPKQPDGTDPLLDAPNPVGPDYLRALLEA